MLVRQPLHNACANADCVLNQIRACMQTSQFFIQLAVVANLQKTCGMPHTFCGFVFCIMNRPLDYIYSKWDWLYFGVQDTFYYCCLPACPQEAFILLLVNQE